MTGNGTKENPYIITTVEELYCMEELGGSDVYFELGNDIDFNGTEYGEHFNVIPLNCAAFDGKNYAIRNIYKHDPNIVISIFKPLSTETIQINNVLFDNITLMGKSINIMSEADCTVNMYNCTLLLNIKRCSNSMFDSSGCCLLHGSGVVVNLELCSIAIKGDYVTLFPFIKRGRVYRTQINVDLCTHNLCTTDDDDSSFFYSVDVQDSWLSGKIKSIDSNGRRYIYMANALSVFNNYFQTVTYEAVPFMYWRASFNGCFYDADVIGSAEFQNRNGSQADGFSALTTAQCKDAEYLKTIGFVCEGGGE